MTATYRFLPWSRRGLAAALTAAPADMPSRAEVSVEVVVAGAGTARTAALLHGPGDVVGLDPDQVVRVRPPAGTTAAEPNLLAAVDLDAPELPWLFTPSGVPADGKLPPWLVLVVVRDRPGVTVTHTPGAPLPRLEIASGAAAELPDLRESWAWAHVQIVEAEGSGADPADALGAEPDGAVARLLCPRRLQPDTAWIAAVVPAFDAGVTRGLGGDPPPDRPVGPAWAPDADAVVLPVYHHWEFRTGPDGDFEALAQRLRPHTAAASVGTTPMHVGDAGPALRVPDGQPRIIDMDGALRAPAGRDGTLDDVPPALVDGLATVVRTLADAADGTLDGQAAQDAGRQPVGPPVYGSAHVRRWSVDDGAPGWLRELNLDPRARVAAGLGAECVRAHQEDVVDAAWRQVGDVLASEAALQRAALALLVAASFHRRHLTAMPDHRLLTVAAPAAARTPVGARSLTAAVAGTSLPDAVLDAGLRRTLAPAGPAVARAAARTGRRPGRLRPRLVAALADGRDDVDPTGFARPVLSGLAGADLGDDLRPLGLAVAAAPELRQRLALAADAAARADRPEPARRLVVRPDLRAAGLLGQAHVDAARVLSERASAGIAGAPDPVRLVSVSTAALLDAVEAGARPGRGVAPAVGFVIRGPDVAAGVPAGTPLEIVPLQVGPGSTLVAGGTGTTVARVEPGLTGAALHAVLAGLPADVLSVRPGAAPAELPLLAIRPRGPGAPTTLLRGDVVRPGPVRPGAGGAGPVPVGPVPVVVGPVVVAPVPAPPPPAGPATVAVPALIRDPGVLGRFEAALTAQSVATVLTRARPAATLVPFDLASAAAALRSHLDPVRSQPLRRDAVVRLGGAPAGSMFRRPHDVAGWWVPRAVDRVMVYPEFPEPAYRMLAGLDSTRLCPGVDAVPPDSVTVLETNPRFVAAFLAGLNHETNRELLWRGYPTDARGTPFRRFWSRLDGRDDIDPVHAWPDGPLSARAVGGAGEVVLMLRGELLRRYPNTVVVAVKATGPRTPDRDPDSVVQPSFAGRFDPDVTFFGFPLTTDELDDGNGWFFALTEPLTEPRYGLDETRGGGAGTNALSWPDTPVAPGGHLGTGAFGALGLDPATDGADAVAATLFQRPFALYVHARHLMTPLPVQR